MDILVGLFLLLSVVFFVLAFFLPHNRLLEVSLGCLIAAVVVLAYGPRILT